MLVRRRGRGGRDPRRGGGARAARGDRPRRSTRPTSASPSTAREVTFPCNGAVLVNDSTWFAVRLEADHSTLRHPTTSSRQILDYRWWSLEALESDADVNNDRLPDFVRGAVDHVSKRHDRVDQRGQALGRPVRRRPVARARGAVAVDPLRLAARALRPGRVARPRQRAARAPACSPTTTTGTLLGGLDALAAAYDDGVAAPGPLRRGRARRPRAAADRGGRPRGRRPAPRRTQSRNDQVATLFKAYLRDQARAVGGAVARPRRRPGRPGARPPRRRHARPDPPPARPAGAAVPPPARPRLAAAPRRRPAARLGRPRGRATRRTARARWPAPAWASTRRPSPRSSASPTRAPTPSTARRPATSWPSSRSSRP